MKNIVNTVLGPINNNMMGRTLMHEHLIFGYPGFCGDISLGKSKETLVEEAVKKAMEVKKLGIETIIDATPNDCGRDPELLKEISEKAELNIICTTGYYSESLGANTYFNFRKDLGYSIDEEIYEMMMNELENGIGNSGIKPGVIKVASSKNKITEYEQAFFKAAARAQKDSNTVIITHTEEGTMGPEQAKLLVESGGIKDKIVIGHMCGNRDFSYHLKVLSQGVYDAFDRYGEENFFGSPTDMERIELMRRIIDSGYQDKLLMSQDTVNVFLGREVEFKGEFEAENQIVMTRISKVLNPMMLEMGIFQEVIDQIQVKNIARLFA